MTAGEDCCSSKKPVRSDSLSRTTGEVASHQETVFRVRGADCSDEVNAIQKALALPEISRVDVSLMNSTVTVRHNASIKSDLLRQLIEKAGVTVVETASLGFFSDNKRRVILVGLSGLLLVLGLGLEWTGTAKGAALTLVFVISTALAGTLVFPKALRAMKQRSLDMNVLMSIAVVGAFAINEQSEAATVVFLFSLAELLEAFSVARARQAIKEVLKLTPQIAHVRRGDALLSLPVLEIGLGERVVVRPGESVPLDGKVIEGSSAVNQAPLTGESRLVVKNPGDMAFAGTINENGTLEIEVTEAFKDTKISRVIALIEEAQDQKAPTERFVDQFAKIYTPVVFVLAILVGLLPPLLLGQSFDLWIYRALVLLVIACPCALVIATPVSVVSGLAALAKRGVLVKGGTHLESLGRLQAVALDKTGTLTEGKFKVQSLKVFAPGKEEELLRVAAGLESVSTHPLAKAVLDYTNERGVKAPKAQHYNAVPGRGAEALIGSHLYFVGNHRFAHDLGVCTPELEVYLQELEEKSLSVIVVGHKPHDGHAGEVLGVFALGDRLRANARDAVQALHKAGIKHIVVLSGDNQKTVDAIRKQSGIDQGLGDLLPEDKVREVKNLTERFKEVAMVGDGVNDAPALANATLGISMGAAGTDTAIETSDVALMQDNLAELPKAIHQGRRVLSVIRFNIVFALATKLAFLVLAIVGISNLWLAVAADLGASLLVTGNALRLLKTEDA